MGLSRLYKGCRKCPYVDTCENKKLEALMYFDEPMLQPNTTMASMSMATPVLIKHDYRDIKVAVNTTITIDLEEIKDSLRKQMMPNFLDYGG